MSDPKSSENTNVKRPLIGCFDYILYCITVFKHCRIFISNPWERLNCSAWCPSCWLVDSGQSHKFLPPAYVVRWAVMFSQVCVCSIFGGGYPIQLMVGGTPSQVWMGGTPSCWREVPHPSWLGGTPSQVWTGGVPHPRSGWGYPIPSLDGGYPRVPSWLGLDGVPPSHDWMRYPSARTGWGTPLASTGWGTPWPALDGVPPPPIRQSSIANTCYVAGGMPLAFTQENFLVHFWKCPDFNRFTICHINSAWHNAGKHSYSNNTNSGRGARFYFGWRTISEVPSLSLVVFWTDFPCHKTALLRIPCPVWGRTPSFLSGGYHWFCLEDPLPLNRTIGRTMGRNSDTSGSRILSKILLT